MKERIMPSLVATTSASARTMFVHTHSAWNNKKFEVLENQVRVMQKCLENKDLEIRSIKKNYDAFETVQNQVNHLKKAVGEKDLQIYLLEAKQTDIEKRLSETKSEEVKNKKNV